MKKYSPISCVYYDFLEHYATIQKEVVVVYFLGQREEIVKGVIKDLKVDDEKVEVLLIKDLKIRLDSLISVDGKMLSDFTHC